MSPRALLDSNVIVAGLASEHLHHAPSLRLLNMPGFAVAAHSYPEAFNTLTRRSGPAPFALPPGIVWDALESVAAKTALVGLSPAQTMDAVRGFAAAGNIGARIYDWLIGQAALMSGIPAVVSWNASHMRSLFPQLRVETPETWR